MDSTIIKEESLDELEINWKRKRNSLITKNAMEAKLILKSILRDIHA